MLKTTIGFLLLAAGQSVPGVVIDHVPASTGTHVGSPAIAILPDGVLVASYDVSGEKAAGDRTIVFRSRDKGATWERLAEVKGQRASSLFLHVDSLYLLGVNREDGDVVIRRSRDGGKMWTDPVDAKSGLLLAGGRFHSAPVPVVFSAGRLWRAVEERTAEWGTGFSPFVMSVPAGADLLDAASWKATNRVAWRGMPAYGGWLEGNVVLTPEGRLVNILRLHEPKAGERAAVMEISPDGARLAFDPERGVLDFPGGCVKFTIHFDPGTGRYWSLTNYVFKRAEGRGADRTRNTLALVSSTDLREWTVRSLLLHRADAVKTGFQYADWLVDGDDLIAVVGTAHDDGQGGAKDGTEANHLTFHRFPGFRTLTIKDSPAFK